MPPAIDFAGQLSKLAELFSQGLLDADEFKAAKARVLAGTLAGAVLPI